MSRLISSTELQEDIDRLMDGWGPNYWRDPHKKLALDSLYEAQLHIESFEAAARKRAQSALPMVAEIYRDRFVERTSDRSPESDSHPASVDVLRKEGAI